MLGGYNKTFNASPDHSDNKNVDSLLACSQERARGVYGCSAKISESVESKFRNGDLLSDSSRGSCEGRGCRGVRRKSPNEVAVESKFRGRNLLKDEVSALSQFSFFS